VQVFSVAQRQIKLATCGTWVLLEHSPPHIVLCPTTLLSLPAYRMEKWGGTELEWLSDCNKGFSNLTSALDSPYPNTSWWGLFIQSQEILVSLRPGVYIPKGLLLGGVLVHWRLPNIHLQCIRVMYVLENRSDSTYSTQGLSWSWNPFYCILLSIIRIMIKIMIMTVTVIMIMIINVYSQICTKAKRR